MERITEHRFTVITTSGTAVLPVEAKLKVGKILAVKTFTLTFLVSVKRIYIFIYDHLTDESIHHEQAIY